MEPNAIGVRTETRDWQVSWNAENRPISFTRGNERVECVYDYMGRRVRKTMYRDDEMVSRRVLVYNGYRLVAELNDLEKTSGEAVSKTWLWDPTGVFDNSPLEMQVWKEEEEYPDLEEKLLLMFPPDIREGTQYPAVRLDTGTENRLNLTTLTPSGSRMELQGMRLTVDTSAFETGVSLKATVSDGQVSAVSRLAVGRLQEYPCLFLFEGAVFSGGSHLRIKLEKEKNGTLQSGPLYILPSSRRSGMAVWKTETEQSADDRFTPGISLYGTVTDMETGACVPVPAEPAEPEGPFFEPTDRDIVLRDRGEGMRIDRSPVWHIPLKPLVPSGKKVILESVELAIGRSPEGKYLEEKDIFFAVNGSWGLRGKSFGNTYRLDLSAMPEYSVTWDEYQPMDFLALEFYGDYPVYCDDRGPLLHITGRLEDAPEPPINYPTTAYPTTEYTESTLSSREETTDYPSENRSNASTSSVDATTVSVGKSDARSASPLQSSMPVAGLSSVPSPSSGEKRKRYYYLNDGNRNIIALRTAEGEICATYSYGTYGHFLKTTGPQAGRNPFRFSSEYYDGELGLIYYNYRHYNPMDGHWLSRDPMEEQGGTNLYGFCSNNPISRVDQLGLFGNPRSGFGCWGNIVREKKPWAIVCYRYYRKASSEEDVWKLLAKANKLNYEEREKWVKGYKPLPEPGDLFFVPNTFIMYMTNLSFWDSYRYHPVNTARKKLGEISLRFMLVGVRVEEYLNEEDRKLFCALWKTKGIFGFGFSGHGAFDKDNNRYVGFATTLDVDNDQPVMPTEVEPEYKLAFIAAFSCGAEDVGWGKTGKRPPANRFDEKLDYPLSEDGMYVAYYGRYTIGKDSSFFMNLNKNTFGILG